MEIPVIDFSKLNGSPEERAKVLAEVANGCEEWGFFQLVNHGISEELLERVNKVCSDCFHGEREEIFKNSDNNEWPSKTSGFKETMTEYRAELKKLAENLMDENLGLKKGYIKKAFNGGDGDEAFFGTKVSHYPPCPHPELVNGLRAHTDAGGIILLFQDDAVGGLQILKDGEWIDVQPLPNTIAINTGDQIEVLSNGKYKSTWHRVLATPDGNRRSIASFYNSGFEASIAPAVELVEKANLEEEEEQQQQTYPKFVFGDYMSVYAEQKFLPKEPRFQAVKAM
ncbi:1-aminocyclopropane-1-carboxylate oxidase family protein [Tripterygium wilfordii]|uniref:aminocyclopropanecarboxylate oxidase n=1 Tax=Tripterygium wilfordii TaxID=458696 RepID=A0A7J7BTK3_TRIWF|nr:1-aminocyclopropane-1-carboxylate oxidase family protein [Tripterygium wilfordii]